MITHTPRRPSVGTLLSDHRLLTECQGEAIIVGDSAQVARLNARLDAIEAELRMRSEAELSVYEAQRWLLRKAGQ